MPSIIQIAAHPNRTLEVDARGNPQVRDSADVQAREVKKGKHYFYDYRAYAAMETEDGLVDTTFTRPANGSETKQFERLVRQLPPGVDGVLADQGLATRENRQYLTWRKRAFATLNRQFHMGRARFFGTDKVQAQVRWAAIGFNLLKAQRKVERLRMRLATA